MFHRPSPGCGTPAILLPRGPSPYGGSRNPKNAGNAPFLSSRNGLPIGETTKCPRRDRRARTGSIASAFGVPERQTGLVQPELLTSMSPEGQAFYQNVRTALPMQLLTQSGQGVTEREYERKMAELVPVPGEAPSVTAAKRRQFAIYAAAVKGLAGRALDKVNAVPAQAPAGSASPAAPALAAIRAARMHGSTPRHAASGHRRGCQRRAR